MANRIHHPNMSDLQAYKIATSNINKSRSSLKLENIKDFLYAADIDILLLQEVGDIDLHHIPGYNAISNPGSGDNLGTAILTKEGIIAYDIERLVTCRGIAATFNTTRIVNVYAPSGNSNRRRRADFFKEEILPLFTAPYDQLILAGDFNCVIHPKDQIPNFNKSIELERIVTDFPLIDTWEHKFGATPGFTYVTNHSASRLDRIYVSDNLKHRILHAEVWPTSFSDHAAYICTLNLKPQGTYRGRGPWKLNVAHLADPACKDAFTQAWNESEAKFHTYDSAIQWWIECAKPKIRKAMMQYSREKNWWFRRTMEFYFQCLRDLYTLDATMIENYSKIKRIQAKILLLKRQQVEGFKIRSRSQHTVENEETSVFHMLREAKRARTKILTELKTNDGTILTTQKEIRNVIQHAYADLMSGNMINEAALADLQSNLTHRLSPADAEDLLTDVTEDELEDAVFHSPKNKSPGSDGIPIELYQAFWPLMKTKLIAICNALQKPDVAIPQEFKEGLVVLIPKRTGTQTVASLRPITLLNSDYKIFARILAKRMKNVMTTVIGSHQTSVGRDRAIYQTLADYRDIIAVADACEIQCALVSLDFAQAFDRVNHSYLFKIMQSMGFPLKFITTVRLFLQNSTSRIIINGQPGSAISINSSVRQGCPMSMALFAIAIEPLLVSLTERLTGLQINQQKIVCRAYADDVALLATNVNELQLALQIITKYEQASGAKLNWTKSGFMNIGRGISTQDHGQLKKTAKMTCLGVDFRSTVQDTIAANYQQLLTKVRACVQQHSTRKLDELQKVELANTYIIAKINYVAQVLPMPQDKARSLLSALGHFVSRGNIFKVKYDTLTLSTRYGGLNLTDVHNKAQALYVCKTYKLWKTSPNSLTAHLLNEIAPIAFQPPIDLHHIPDTLEHFREFFVDYSYIHGRVPAKKRTVVREIYKTLMENKSRNVVEHKFPNNNWRVTWENIHSPHLPSKVKAMWYKLVNRKIPTKSRLHAIHLADSPLCLTCSLIDSDEHIFVCNLVQDVWDYVRQKLASIRRTSPNAITPADFLNPDEIPFPKMKRNAVNWLMGHTVYYLLSTEETTKEAFKIYLTIQHQKIVRKHNYKENFANFLIKTIL